MADAAASEVDEARFTALYHRFARPLWLYLRRLTGNASVADDLLQETFCRLLTAGPPAQDPTAIRGWLFRVASNLAMDHFRRQGRAPRAIEDADEPQIAPPMADAFEERAMRETFATLAPRERAIVWLSYVEGASHREIAEAVGIKVGSVRVMLFRAKQRLASLLLKLGRTS